MLWNVSVLLHSQMRWAQWLSRHARWKSWQEIWVVLRTATVSSHRDLSPASPDTNLDARSSIISVCSAFLRRSSFCANFSSYCFFNSAIFASTYIKWHTLLSNERNLNRQRLFKMLLNSRPLHILNIAHLDISFIKFSFAILLRLVNCYMCYCWPRLVCLWLPATGTASPSAAALQRSVSVV